MKNTVTHEQIDTLFSQSIVETDTWLNKTFVMKCRLPNGFIIVESASCVDPANFSVAIGYEICAKRIKNRLWELEGYALQKSIGQ
jgi:hypothetical protein